MCCLKMTLHCKGETRACQQERFPLMSPKNQGRERLLQLLSNWAPAIMFHPKTIPIYKGTDQDI